MPGFALLRNSALLFPPETKTPYLSKDRCYARSFVLGSNLLIHGSFHNFKLLTQLHRRATYLIAFAAGQILSGLRDLSAFRIGFRR